jgi:molybdopterin-binding protein
MLSARHRLPGTVKSVNLGAAEVIVTVGQFELATAITRGSDSLGLKVGGQVKVVIKVTEVLVETPRRGKGSDDDGSGNAQAARGAMRQSPNPDRFASGRPVFFGQGDTLLGLGRVPPARWSVREENVKCPNSLFGYLTDDLGNTIVLDLPKAARFKFIRGCLLRPVREAPTYLPCPANAHRGGRYPLGCVSA